MPPPPRPRTSTSGRPSTSTPMSERQQMGNDENASFLSRSIRYFYCGSIVGMLVNSKDESALQINLSLTRIIKQFF